VTSQEKYKQNKSLTIFPAANEEGGGLYSFIQLSKEHKHEDIVNCSSYILHCVPKD
jgi:hypothetical protein